MPVAVAHFPGPESMPTKASLRWMRQAIISASPEPNPPHRSPGPTPGRKTVSLLGSGLRPSQSSTTGMRPERRTASTITPACQCFRFFFQVLVLPS